MIAISRHDECQVPYASFMSKMTNKPGLNWAKLRSNWDLVSLLLFTIEDEGMPARWDQHAIGAAWQWT